MDISMEDIFGPLNESQLEAVTATEGYVRIVAGAGSGKTKTLTHRYAYLVKAAGIHPGNVLCVTFTNKAAGEMKRRVRDLIGDGNDTSLITTYHGFCVRVLRDDIYRLFYPNSFTILDESDQRRILTEIYSELDLKMDRGTFESILESIHRVKVDENYVGLLTDGNIDAISVPPASPTTPTEPLETDIIHRYLAKQRKIYALDFDDLICFTFDIFKRYPEVLEKWAEKLYYIQVDEFQDSSRRELSLIRMLSAVHGNLFVVGDPDQNIYEWRGADMSILVNFDKEFPDVQTIMLNRNYRSTGNILRCANTVIAKNKNRIKKDLYTKGAEGAPVIHLHSKTEQEEGKWISDEIKRLVREEGMKYRDIAVLYRSGFLSRFIEQSFMANSVPYELFGSLRFYERMEVKDAIAYLKLVAGDDDEAFERVVNTPRRSIGKSKLEKLKSLALTEGTSLYAALKNHREDKVFTSTGAGSFIDAIEKMRSGYADMQVSETVKDILAETGYEDYIRKLGSMERLENLAELKRAVWEKEQSYGEKYTLEDYLRDVSLESDLEADSDVDRVKLMTIHSSKGLEFPVCFVCGFTEGIFPSGRSMEERKEEGLEEERRLCFVALTRAMKRLYLTESEGTSGDSSHKKPSRFIYDIGEENYTRIGTIPKELRYSVPKSTESAAPKNEKSIGDEVTHPIFGHGKITDIDRSGRIYYITFDKNGARRPVSMDYNFDTWQNLNAVREEARENIRKRDSGESKALPESETIPSRDAIADKTEARRDEVGEAHTDVGEKIELSDGVITGVKFEEKNDNGDILPCAVLHDSDVPHDSTSTDREETETIRIDVETVITEDETDATPDEIAHAEKNMPEKYRSAEWAMSIDGETNLWKRTDVPHEGWTCVDIIDLGAPVGVCRMCGYQIIRYVHVMRHPDYRRTIGAGCVCAGRMEGNAEAARDREKAFKNRQARFETYIKLKPKKSKNGNLYLRYKDEVVTVMEDRFRKGFYKYVCRETFSSLYPTKEEAFAAAFDLLDPPVIPGKHD